MSGRDWEVCCDAARQDEGGDAVAGKLVCFMSPECLTHRRGAELCPRINISWVPVQHGDGRVQLYYMQKRMMGPELETCRIRGRTRILQNMKRGEEAL